MTITHWIDSAKNRNKFWARANELALEKADVYAALEVESVHDFKGTFGEAMACLNLFADAMAEGEAELQAQTNVPEPTHTALLQQIDLVLAEPDRPDEVPPGVELTRGSQEVFEACTMLPESPAWVSTKFVDRQGFLWTISLLAGLTGDLAKEALASLFEQMILFHKAAQHNEWLPEGSFRNEGYSQKPTNSTPPPPPNVVPFPTPPHAAAPAPAAPEAPPQSGSVVAATGSANLISIQVDGDGKVKFDVQGFKYPFSDSRGGETVAGLFDASAGDWTAAHFAPGSFYNLAQNKLSVDWEKVTKFKPDGKPVSYYNVLKVYVPESPF